MTYTERIGSPSLDSGVVSATRSINTVAVSIKVTPMPIRSPKTINRYNDLCLVKKWNPSTQAI